MRLRSAERVHVRICPLWTVVCALDWTLVSRTIAISGSMARGSSIFSRAPAAKRSHFEMRVALHGPDESANRSWIFQLFQGKDSGHPLGPVLVPKAAVTVSKDLRPVSTYLSSAAENKSPSSFPEPAADKRPDGWPWGRYGGRGRPCESQSGGRAATSLPECLLRSKPAE